MAKTIFIYENYSIVQATEIASALDDCASRLLFEIGKLTDDKPPTISMIETVQELLNECRESCIAASKIRAKIEEANPTKKEPQKVEPIEGQYDEVVPY